MPKYAREAASGKVLCIYKSTAFYDILLNQNSYKNILTIPQKSI